MFKLQGFSLVLAALTLAGCTVGPLDSTQNPGFGDDQAIGHGGSATAPSLSVGDRWTIEFETDYDAEPDEVQVTALETVRIAGVAHKAFKVEHTDGPRVEWRREGDDALLRVQYSRFEVTYDPPCVQYRWPMQVGQVYSSTCQFTSVCRAGCSNSDVSTSSNTVTITVEAIENVTVPAGTFEAFRIHVRNDGYPATTVLPAERVWFAPAACGPVQTKDVGGPMPGSTALSTISCAKPGHTQPA